MIMLGNAVRLSANDKNRLTMLTGAVPDHVNSIQSLNDFVKFHKGIHQDSTPEGKLLSMLLEDEII